MDRVSDDQAQVALVELASLLAATRRVAGLLDSAVLAQRAAQEARQLIGTEIATLALLEGPSLLVMRGTSGVHTPALAKLRIPRGTGLGGRILLERRPISVHDYARDAAITRDHVDVVVAGEGIRSIAGVPIEDADELLGVLYGGLREIGTVGERGEAMLMEFARSLAPILRTARQAEDAQRLKVAEERQRIALDLHDTMGQLLFGIGLAARRAQEGVGVDPQANSADLIDHLRQIEEGASRAASQLREALRTLAPATPREALATTVQMDVAAFSDRSGVPADFMVVGESRDLSGVTQSVVLAVVREGLHNAEKYAGATSVIVTLYYGASDVGVVIQDDGVGLPVDLALDPLPRGGRRLGLASLAQRAQQLGGTLEIIPNEDGGVTLRANLPTA
jgi:signal transduction histidine kinase